MQESNFEETAVESEAAPIWLKRENCAKCLTCYLSCPYEAISIAESKIHVELDKCQVCGLCASLCPEYNIEMAYYDCSSLIDRIKGQMEAMRTRNLVVMCRGSSPQSCDILNVLRDHDVDTFIPLRLPCVGRLPVEFYLGALSLGIEKVITVQCDEDYCRYKRGSGSSIKKIARLEALLKEAGFEGNVITLIKNPQKAVYETEKCVGCDKCGFICPYDAIDLQPLATPRIVFESCKGCGACALVCPHLAIQLEGFEYETSSGAIQRHSAELWKRKEEGIGPNILVFCCQWAEFSALDAAQDGFTERNAFLMEVPCLNGLDPVQILEAFNAGFDGVLAYVCSEEDCKSKEGRAVSENNMAALEKILRVLRLADRFEIYTASPRNLGEFESTLESFKNRISPPRKHDSAGERENV